MAGSNDDNRTGTDLRELILGTDEAEIIDGSGGSDLVDGSGGNDLIFGGRGNDSLLGGAGNDLLFGESGNDLIRGGTGNDVIKGGKGNDFLLGDGGDDSIEGGAGNDLLIGGEGNDSLDGGAGDDVLVGGAGNDTLTGGEGSDTFVILAEDGTTTITDFDVANDTLDLGELNANITLDLLLAQITDLPDSGTADGVTIDLTDFGGGTITLDGVTKADLMDGEVLNTALFLLPDGSASRINFVGYEEGTEITVGEGADDVWGGEGNDTIDGLGGDDWIFGEEGDDSIAGGAGNDMILGGEGNDSIAAGNDDDDVWGGEGNDTIDGDEGNDRLRGDGGDDSISGGAGDDVIFGGSGNDVIDGGAGEDRIAGGSGDDRLTGGTDTDTFIFGEGHGDDTITDFADGTDLIDLRALGITSFGALTITADGNDAVIDTGEGTIKLVGVSTTDLDASRFLFETEGSSGNDTIDGSVRADVIEGLGGDDRLTGGGEADTFVFESGHGNDTITDFADGTDLIDLSALGITHFGALTITADGNDAVIDTGEGTIRLVGVSTTDLDASRFLFETEGGSGNDTIDGSVRADVIEGLGGDDRLTGGGEADTFVFASSHGNDTITDFEDGTDFADGTDLIDLSALAGVTSFGALTITTDGNDAVIDTGAGTIRLVGVSKDDLDADNFVFSRVGDEGNDTITGDETGEWLSGHGGDDSIDGGGGDDFIILGGAGNDTIDGGEGHDWIDGGADNDTIDGGAGDDWIYGEGGADVISGGAGDDIISGGEGNDTIDGGAGEDWIHGGTGNDSLTGGGGADTFAFGSSDGDDTITDFADGTDLIDLSVLAGATSFGALSITTDGNDAVIDTGAGTIRLVGVSKDALDADNFVFSNVGDEGNDTITGDENMEWMEGRGGDDSIDGGGGEDWIYGEGGDDVIYGGEGNDTLTGGADDDTFVFQAGHGTDKITDFTDGEDLIDVSALGITALSGLTFTTNSSGNVVIDTGADGGTIELQGVTDSANLTAEDFIFAPPTEDLQGDNM